MSNERTSTRDRKEEQRFQRIPMGGARTKLDTDQRDGYVRRWINDTGSRLADAERAGYAYVTEVDRVGDPDVTNRLQPGSKVAKQVGRDKMGQAITAYLMEIRKDWYEEDQAAKQARIDEIDDQIRSGSLKREPGDGRYVPKGGISYRP